MYASYLTISCNYSLTPIQNVLKKIEWRVAAWAAIAFFALDLDRSNISQANTDNFLDDLGLTTNGKNPTSHELGQVKS